MVAAAAVGGGDGLEEADVGGGVGDGCGAVAGGGVVKVVGAGGDDVGGRDGFGGVPSEEDCLSGCVVLNWLHCLQVRLVQSTAAVDADGAVENDNVGQSPLQQDLSLLNS